MKLVTAKQMRDLDAIAINKCRIPSLKLMENAGVGVAKIVKETLGKSKGSVVIIAGKGNNGGDGLVAARHLINDGYDVHVILFSSHSNLSADSRANWELLAQISAHIHIVTESSQLSLHAPLISQSRCIVDAIFGTGLSSDLKGIALEAVELINISNGSVVAVDIPSGLSADDGKPLGIAVRADTTVTFGLPKKGLVLNEGLKYCGKIKIVDIGIPEEESGKVNSNLYISDPSIFSEYFVKRKYDAHKGTYGHVLIFAGSRGHLGAGYLASKSALKSGCGLVTYCLPHKAFAYFDARYPEIMCDTVPDDNRAFFTDASLSDALNLCDGKNAVGIGPALGKAPETASFLNNFVKGCPLPLVIDADGLNLLDISSLRFRKAPTVLTPHPGEMGRLLETDTKTVQKRRIEIASEFSKKSGAIVVLKGAGTVVAAPDGRISVNVTGNAGMATAGMGDALTGMLTSFLAQGIPEWEAANAAVYIHGLAGDIASKEHTQRALITSDLIKAVGAAIKTVEL